MSYWPYLAQVDALDQPVQLVALTGGAYMPGVGGRGVRKLLSYGYRITTLQDENGSRP